MVFILLMIYITLLRKRHCLLIYKLAKAIWNRKTTFGQFFPTLTGDENAAVDTSLSQSIAQTTGASDHSILPKQPKYNVRFQKEIVTVFHPNQFQVNETWIIFKINNAPVVTDADGDFNIFALMDAASCFILGTGFIPTDSKEFSQVEAKQLLNSGHSHKKQYPKELIIPNKQLASILSKEAERCGISIVRVPEEQLKMLIGEAREGFQKHLSKGRVQ